MPANHDEVDNFKKTEALKERIRLNGMTLGDFLNAGFEDAAKIIVVISGLSKHRSLKPDEIEILEQIVDTYEAFVNPAGPGNNKTVPNQYKDHETS